MAYKLSQVLQGHSQDVRAVATYKSHLILTASRDETVRSWRSCEKSGHFTLEKIYHGHSGFINSVAIIGESNEHPLGLYISGGNDGLINVYDPLGASDPLYTLIGHSGNVCSLSVLPNSTIFASGSWDSTARTWQNFKEKAVLRGHSHAVWAVLTVATQQHDFLVITGSADRSIAIWSSSGLLLKQIQAHSDCVRGLIKLKDETFASCSNDGTLKIWSFDGNSLLTLSGHTSFVYSLAYHMKSDSVISGGEDRTVKVWKVNERACTYTIVQPCTSIWCVGTLENGDIVCGLSDHTAKIFTLDASRFAPAIEIEFLLISWAFDHTVANYAISSNQLGGINKENLPGVQALEEEGKKDQELKMIYNGFTVEAHQWDAATRKWIKVGEVVDAVGSGSKKLYNGKEYDYVFDVDVGDNTPPIKLPYNATDNPFNAAEQFVTVNDLPREYVTDVADFIIKNTAGVALQDADVVYSDPWTGKGRYVPEADKVTPSTQSTQSTQHRLPDSAEIPQQSFVVYSQLQNSTLLKKKLFEFNSKITDLTATLLDADKEHVTELLEKIENQKYSVTDAELKTLSKILRWPFDKRFPGIDILRVAALDPEFLVKAKKAGLADIIQVAENTMPTGNQQPSKPAQTLDILTFRLLSNLFKSASNQTYLNENKERVLSYLIASAKRLDLTNKMLCSSFVNLMLNTAVLTTDSIFAVNFLSFIAKFMEKPIDADCTTGIVIAVGTLISKGNEVKEAAGLLDFKEKLEKIPVANSTKLQNLTAYVKAML